MPKVKVLVIDDSALVRKILSDLLNQDPKVEVVGTAADGAFAMRKIRELEPHVITLDVEMRQVGGLEFLSQLMQEHPLPVIMVSAHTQRGAEVTLKALELGAVDFVAKPHAGGAMGLAQVGEELVEKVKQAAQAKVRRPVGFLKDPPPAAIPVRPAPRTTPTGPVGASRYDVIAIGASTGGTEAVREVLLPMRLDCPGILVVQHMPEGFTAAFARRLDGLCQIRVREARTGDVLEPGLALIAPGHAHLKLRRWGGRLQVVLDQGPAVNRHRPSVEVLFLSVAEVAGRRAIGVMLTGMGADGARAMLDLRNSGAHTIAQSEDSCVVFGMPKEAIACGAAREVVPLNKVADRIYSLLPGYASSR